MLVIMKNGARTLLVLTLASAAACAQPPRGFRGMRGGDLGLDVAPVAKDEAEKRILSVMEQTPRSMNVPREDGRLIRILTEAVTAKQAVEFGTSTGISGLWFAMALRNTGGRLTTFDIDPAAIAIARETYRKAGVDHLITIVEGDAHEKVKSLKGPIDIVFIDADKDGYRDYLEKILPLVRPGGLILAHNINGRGSNPEYVDAVTTNPALDTVLFNSQMTLTVKKR
jgi:predicted O-methyltransferase YrrM